MNRTITFILETYDSRGDDAYGSEAVTQREHALQCATLAEKETSDAQLVAAALLHDMGHLMHDRSFPQDAASNLDDAHENRAFDWLTQHFGPRVADPVRLHVKAKRFLCTIDPTYVDALSPTSLKSFHDQGGSMSDDELQRFRAETFHAEAVRLRRWDDLAKTPSLATSPIEHFVPHLQSAILSD